MIFNPFITSYTKEKKMNLNLIPENDNFVSEKSEIGIQNSENEQKSPF